MIDLFRCPPFSECCEAFSSSQPKSGARAHDSSERSFGVYSILGGTLQANDCRDVVLYASNAYTRYATLDAAGACVSRLRIGTYAVFVCPRGAHSTCMDICMYTYT